MKKIHVSPNDDLKESEKLPCEVFDAIGGVGTGGYERLAKHKSIALIAIS